MSQSQSPFNCKYVDYELVDIEEGLQYFGCNNQNVEGDCILAEEDGVATCEFFEGE